MISIEYVWVVLVLVILLYLLWMVGSGPCVIYSPLSEDSEENEDEKEVSKDD